MLPQWNIVPSYTGLLSAVLLASERHVVDVDAFANERGHPSLLDFFLGTLYSDTHVDFSYAGVTDQAGASMVV